jgi:hypothetical protein
MTVKLQAKLPESGSPENGLSQSSILKNPKRTITVVAVLHLESYEVKPQTGLSTNPSLVIDVIEPIEGPDTLVVQEIASAHARRRIDPDQERTGSLFEDDVPEMTRTGPDQDGRRQ